jgi:hypothetical protein
MNPFLIGILFFVSVFCIAYVVVINLKDRRLRSLTPEERKEQQRAAQEALATRRHGPLNPAMICPHCQTKGSVRKQPKNRKSGISGVKAAAALLTGGFSLLATGLSGSETVTQAHCTCCDCTWVFWLCGKHRARKRP